MEQRAFELLCYLSPTPALKDDLAADMGISAEDVRERIGMIRAVGIRIVETVKTVRIDPGSWPAAKRLLAEHSQGDVL